MNQPFNVNDDEHIRRLREVAAGIIRDLLSAANGDDSSGSVLTPEIREQWWNAKNKPSRKPVDRLLNNAANNLRAFPVQFAGSLNSVAYSDTDNQETVEDRVESLRDHITDFASFTELKEAAAKVKTQSPVDWNQLCRWDLLPEIRRLLDQFPDTANRQPGREITDLTVEPPNIVRYRGRLCGTPNSQCWKLLNCLLNCKNHSTDIEGLGKAVWNGDVPGWGAVHSELRRTREFFKRNKIPHGISANQGLNQIYLIKLPRSVSKHK